MHCYSYILQIHASIDDDVVVEQPAIPDDIKVNHVLFTELRCV